MDDSTFDDLIRKKLKDHQDPLFDPEALGDLHERMQGHNFKQWYNYRAMQIAMVALLLLSGSNTYFILSNQKLQQQLLTENIRDQKNNNSLYAIDSLHKVIAQLQCETETRPIEYVEYGNAKTPTVKSPDFQLRLITVADYKTDSSREFTNLKLGIGQIKNIPANVYQQLNERGWLTEEDGEAVLNLSEQNHPYVQTSVRTKPEDLLLSQVEPGLFRIVSVDAKPEEKKILTPSIRQGEKSLQARNVLEKHYYNGIGIQLAPHVDLMQGIFSEGTGQITPRVGITADWILSPHISVESGLDYSTTEINLNKNEICFKPDYAPGGTLLGAMVTNKLFSTPVSFKYRRWVSDKSQLVLRTSFTPYWSMSRIANCSYTIPDTYPDADIDRFTTTDQKDQFKFYNSTIGTSVGLTLKREKNKGTWEASVFYEHGVGTTSDQSTMQLIGLRASHWFKIK